MKPLTRITDFVLGQIETQPDARRISLYRDLAAISGTAQQARALTELADNLADCTLRQAELDLDLAECKARHAQLVLDFKRRAEG